MYDSHVIRRISIRPQTVHRPSCPSQYRDCSAGCSVIRKFELRVLPEDPLQHRYTALMEKCKGTRIISGRCDLVDYSRWTGFLHKGSCEPQGYSLSSER